MAKSFKRTLIAAFGLLFLFATAFVAASCAEEAAVESYKVTLDYDDTHGSVTLSPEAENDTYVSGTSVTVTVTPSGDYTVGTFKVNGEDKTLTNENTFTFDVVQDTTVAVTFNPPVPTPPTLDISEKWVGTYTGNNVMADPEAVWVISITDTAVSLTIDGDAQTITDVEFALDDDSFIFTLDGETVMVDAYGQEDGYGVYTLSVGTETYSVVASLTDASKVPPEPPLGDTITAFPDDFRGTWYGTESYDGVLYTIVVNDTTMTITAGDGSPTTINVADVLYDAQDGEDDFGYPTLYFTYNDTEESTLELGYDGEYLVFESGDIYVSTLTHDMPEPEYGNPTNFLLEIEGTYVNGGTRFAVYNASVTTFVVLNDPVDFTVLGLDPDSATDVLVIEDNYDGTLYRFEKDGGDLTLTGGYLDGITLTKQEEVHVLPSAFYGKWYRPGDTDYFYDVSDTGTVQWNAYFADPKDVDVVGIDGVYTLDGSTATLTDNNTILVVAGDDRINYYYKEGLTPTLPDGLANTEWTGVQIATVSFNNNNVSIGPSTYYVYHVNDDGSFNAYANASMHRFTYSGGVLTCDDEQLTREGGEVPSDGIPADFDGTYKTPDGTHTIVIADGSMTYDATPATGVEPYGDGSYDVTIGEDGYVLTLTDFGTVKICSWSGDDGTQSFFVPDGTVSGKINAALVGTWKGTADAWYDDNGPSEDAAIFGDMTFVVADDGSATLNGEDAFVFVTAEDDGEYSYWFIGANKAFGSCTYLISYIPAEDPDTIALTLLGVYYNDLAKEEAGPTYDDPTAFLNEIEGSWSFPSIYFGDTTFVVSGGEVTKFEFNGTDYTDSVNVLGLDKSGKLVVEAGGVQYFFTYVSQYDSLTVSNESGDEHDLNRTVVQNTLPSDYVGKWVAINGEAYIVVAQDGTAKYYANADAAGTDLTVVGSGSSYSFDDATFDDGTLALKEDNRVLTVGNLNFAKDGVEVSDEEKLPEELRGTKWDCAVSFSISSFTFDADGLTANTGDTVYHVYFAHFDSASNSYTFNAYSGDDVHSFEYTHGALYVDGEYTFLKGEGGDESTLAAFAGTYQEANGTRTLVISADGSVTVDSTPADSVKPDGEGAYTVTVGDSEYTLTPTDYIAIKICALSDGETQAFFVPNGTEEATVNAALVGTWNGAADGWSDPMGTAAFGAITLVVNDDGSATLNGEDTFVFFGSDDVSDTYTQYSYYLVGTSEMFGSLVYMVEYIPGEDPNVVAVTVTVLGESYNLDLTKEGSVVPGDAKIDESLYGTWRGTNLDENYVVKIDAEGVHFTRNSGTSVDGDVHDVAADGLSFDVDVQFPNTMVPYNYHAVYSDADSTLTLTEGSVQVVLTKDSADMETIPTLYQGSWVLADYNDSTKIVGSIVVTKNTITLTYNGRSYSTVTITLDDVDASSKVTFIADGDEFSLSTDAYSGEGAYLGKPNPGGWNDLIATLEEEGYSGTFEIPESVRGDYHTEDNSITLKVTDTTVTGTIDGKEVTFNVTDLKTQMDTVTISLTDDDGGKGYLSFYEGDVESEIPAEYTFFWQAADAVGGGKMHDLVKDGAVDPTAHPLTGTWNTASSDSAFAGKAIVVDHDGGVTVGGDAATLAEDGSSWKLTFGGKDYTITNDKTYGSDVLVINDPDGGVHFAFRDGVTHSVDLNVEALVGKWENTDEGITIVVTADGITFNGETAFAYAYYNDTEGYKILAGGVQYNFSTTGSDKADVYNMKTYHTTHLTKVPDPEEPIEGLADWVGTYKTVGGAHTVVVTEGSIKLDGTVFTGLTKQDADFSGTLDGDSYLISRAADGNWLSVKKTSDNSVVYYVKDGADGVAVPSALDGTYTDGDSTHTVVIAGGTLTLDSTQTFVYEASETEVKFFVEGGSGSFTVAEGVYTLTLTGTADAGATTLTKSDVKEEPIEGLADFVGTYKTLDKAHTVVVTETGITVSGTALTEITAGDGDGVFTAKKGTTDCTVRLYDRYVNIGSDYYVKDGEVSLTVDSKFDGTHTGTGISSHSEYTFVIKDGKITLNGEEAFVLTSSNGSFRLLFVDGRSGSLVSYDNGASFTYTSGSDTVRLVKVIEGGGADGVVSFDKKISRKDMIGTFTGTDKQERNWTVTTTETSIKIEINGVVQTLTKVSSYGDNGIDFTIDGIGECSFMWWSMDNACVVQFHSDWTTCTLTKA